MKLHIPMLRRAGEAAPRVRAHAVRSVELHERLRKESPEKVKKTLFTNAADAGEDGSLSFEEVVANAQTYVIAGTDTTATTLVYLVWCVCRRSSLRDALVQELRRLPPDFSDSDLKALPHLNNTINETLRLHGAVPSALPRMVPSGGARLAGHYVPEGTTVCCQAYSLHRSPDIWKDPETFDPSRWDSPSKAMTDAFMPFGAGARSECW